METSSKDSLEKKYPKEKLQRLLRIINTLRAGDAKVSKGSLVAKLLINK